MAFCCHAPPQLHQMIRSVGVAAAKPAVFRFLVGHLGHSRGSSADVVLLVEAKNRARPEMDGYPSAPPWHIAFQGLRISQGSSPAEIVHAHEVIAPARAESDEAGESMAKTQITQTADEGKAYERVEIERLLLDPNNPRLAEYALGNKPTQQELLKILWQKMAVDELAMSIGAGTFRTSRSSWKKTATSWL